MLCIEVPDRELQPANSSPARAMPRLLGGHQSQLLLLHCVPDVDVGTMGSTEKSKVGLPLEALETNLWLTSYSLLECLCKVLATVVLTW